MKNVISRNDKIRKKWDMMFKIRNLADELNNKKSSSMNWEIGKNTEYSIEQQDSIKRC